MIILNRNRAHLAGPKRAPAFPVRYHRFEPNFHLIFRFNTLLKDHDVKQIRHSSLGQIPRSARLSTPLVGYAKKYPCDTRIARAQAHRSTLHGLPGAEGHCSGFNQTEIYETCGLEEGGGGRSVFPIGWCPGAGYPKAARVGVRGPLRKQITAPPRLVYSYAIIATAHSDFEGREASLESVR